MILIKLLELELNNYADYKKQLFNITFLGVISIIFISCGGGGDSVPDEKIEQTGTFVDAPVQGLRYKTTTREGFTNANGEFKYLEGEKVSFYIGNISLGEVNAKETVTPLTLGGDTSLNTINNKSINIARILQTLDSTSDEDTIILPESLKDLEYFFSIDWNNIDTSELNTILSKAQALTNKPGGYSLKSANDAKFTMKNFLQTYLYNGSYTGTTQYSSSSILSASQCGSNTTWNIKVTDGATITGYAYSGAMEISGLQLSDSNITGSTSDGTLWNAVIDEDGNVQGTYNYGSGQCVGTMSGAKVTRPPVFHNDLKEEVKNAVLAEANTQTAQILLGKEYQLNGSSSYGDTNNSTKSRDSNGTKNYQFLPNTLAKTFTQKYEYNDYFYIDDICEEKTFEIDGSKECVGDYNKTLKLENGNTRYFFTNKECIYKTQYDYNNYTYFKGGKYSIDYDTKIYTRTNKYTYEGDTRAKIDFKYYYNQDNTEKTYEKYHISGKWYFDNLTKYVIVDDTIDNSINKNTYDLCNYDYKGGSYQFITKDDTKLRFTATDTNVVLVEKKELDKDWESIGTFTK
jgi:hypothetical protein